MITQIGFRAARFAIVISLAAFLPACGSMSEGISKDGTSAKQLIWPSIEGTNPLAEQGIYPTQDTLSLLHPGLTKKQLQKLIGPPHFNEGVITREWDYLFHIRKSDSKSFYNCQFKVLFNSAGISGSNYWMPRGCGFPKEPAEENKVLQTDGLFRFDGWKLSSLHSDSRQRLEAFAAMVRQPMWHEFPITVRAYTDRIGGEIYNQQLSERRAQAVSALLMERGVLSSRIRTLGEGIKPIVTSKCSDTLKRNELIECLSSDRRVELEVGPMFN